MILFSQILHSSALDPDLFDAEGSSDNERGDAAGSAKSDSEQQSDSEEGETVNKLSKKFSGVS
jgi:hypothetical protein